MKLSKEFYIFQNCRIKRKDNNILIENETDKKNIKSEIVEDIYVFGEVDLNTKLLNFLSQKGIKLHIFNYYGFYSGTFFPKKEQVSGELLIKQVSHFLEYSKRLYIAKEFIEAAAYNIIRNVRYYKNRNVDIKQDLDLLNFQAKNICNKDTIESLMGIEGNIRKTYYKTWTKIINQEVEFKKRIRRPPDNKVNSLISFINSLFYTTVLSEIYKTQLDPTISFLHEPGTKRFSLGLDISEVFKPILVDRLIFSLLNKNQIQENDFIKESNFLYLKDSGKKTIIQEYNKVLARTIMHKKLKRKVSYRYLIRLECYKLIKHLIQEKNYESFKMWW